MDLSLNPGDKKLNIRVALMLKTPNGYIFELGKSGFYVPVGGSIQKTCDINAK